LDYASNGGFWQAIRENRTCPDIPEDVEVEQYTGLHDKEEAWYHNDIITDGKKNWLIDWSEEYLTWILTNPNMKGTINLCDINSRLFHCIGNIHENTELLDEHK
jgi:hypothetical protein